MSGSPPPDSADGYVFRQDRQDPYLRLLCVNIFVRDQERSLRFYTEQLGFSVVVDENYESGGRWVAVAPPDGSTVLALVTPKRKSEEYKLIGRARHAVLVTEDVMAKFEEWRKRGVRFHHPPQTTLWGGIFTRFDDVDGNSFALVGRDDFVREIEAERRAAAEKLEAERRAAQEVEIAKQVQARLFPQTLPQLKTLQYAGICMQAREVGGDYYDFLDLGQERLALVLADTSAKGIGAALLMANLQANLRSQSAIALDQPQRFLRSVNELFTRTRLTAPMRPFSLPNTTIKPGTCVTRIVGTTLPSCSAITASRGSIRQARYSDCSRSGTARSRNDNCSPATY
jgi:catechol 2,3-dioxygenase-like lactoylglutathione lyase family enzyme